jgi:hypothetical protein
MDNSFVIRFQINRVDVYANNSYSNSFFERHNDYCGGCAYVEIDFSEPIFAGADFHQRLSVYDGGVRDFSRVRLHTAARSRRKPRDWSRVPPLDIFVPPARRSTDRFLPIAATPLPASAYANCTVG